MKNDDIGQLYARLTSHANFGADVELELVLLGVVQH